MFLPEFHHEEHWKSPNQGTLWEQLTYIQGSSGSKREDENPHAEEGGME